MVAAVRYTDAQKQQIIDDFHTSGLGVTEYLRLDGKPSYPVFSKWLKAADAKSGSAASGANTASAGSLYDEFTQSLLPQDVEKKYIKFLEKKVEALEAELASLKGQ